MPWLGFHNLTDQETPARPYNWVKGFQERRSFTISFLLIAAASTLVMRSQELPDPVQQLVPAPSALKEQSTKNAAAGCLEPPPLPGLDDYDGPLEKTVGIFARALERKSAVQAHYKPGAMLCSLEFRDKFRLFLDDSFDPVTCLSAGIDAGMDQAANTDPTFGQGTAGYARRFASDLADRVSSKFWKDFAYPSIFFEDPRYYPLGQGGTQKRIFHAAEHLFVAHRPDGRHMFNYSEWLGTTTAVLLSDLHHPGNEHGAWPTTREVGYRFAWDIGFDMLREFWPDIARKFKLPFRGVSKQQDLGLALDKKDSRATPQHLLND